jgi:RES domain-containing protein
MPVSRPSGTVSVRVLADPMRVYRIGDPRGTYPIYSGEGASRIEGRWHEKGQEVIYTSRHYSTALLEKLAHFNGVLPSNQHYIEIEIPKGVSYEIVTKDSLPGWLEMAKARAAGSDWYREKRSAILIVPSFVARIEENVIINCTHPDAARIRPGLEHPVAWDMRLFQR